MAEGGEAKRSCPPPTEDEQAQERRADEARGAAATRAQRSPKQPKPLRLERKAAAGVRSSRSRADWSVKLPPEPEEAEAAPTGAESCRRSPKKPKQRRLERKAAAEALLCPLPPKLLPLCIVSRETFILNCST